MIFQDFLGEENDIRKEFIQDNENEDEYDRLNSEITKVLQSMNINKEEQNKGENLNIVLNSESSDSDKEEAEAASSFFEREKKSFHSDHNVINCNTFNTSFESSHSNNSLMSNKITGPSKFSHHSTQNVVRGFKNLGIQNIQPNNANYYYCQERKKSNLFSSFSPFRFAKGCINSNCMNPQYAPRASFVNYNNNFPNASSFYQSNIFYVNNNQDINNCNCNCSNANVPYSPSNSFILERPKQNRQFFTPQYKKPYSKKEKKKNLDNPRNKIRLENIIRQKDKRTTLMIRHIPNKYTLQLLSDEINSFSFKNKYDFLYLPLDLENHCNLGYGLINFIDPIHIIAFYDTYNGKKWNIFKSVKICELAYAKIQGKEELLNHLKQGGIDNNYTNNNFNNQMYLINEIPEDRKRIPIELPLKYLDAFLSFYRYSQYEIVGQDKFVVKSLYSI